MATRKTRKKRKPLTLADRLRMERNAIADIVAQRMVTQLKESLNSLNGVIRAEVRVQVEPQVALLWERKYQEMVDRRVVDVVKSLRLRFAESAREELFDIGRNP